MKKLRRNRLKCLKCDEIIESVHVHDLNYCGCGNAFIDGGLEYIRMGGKCLDTDTYEMLAEYYEDGE